MTEALVPSTEQHLAPAAPVSAAPSSAPPSLLWINHFAVSPTDGGGTRHFELARELTHRHGWHVTIAASDFHLHTRSYTRRSVAAPARSLATSPAAVRALATADVVAADPAATPSPSLRAPIAERIDDVEFLWLWAAPYARNDWRRAHNWLSFARSVSRAASTLVRTSEHTPDVVIGSSPHLFAALAGARAARKLGVPFVLEVRDLWPESLLAAGGRKGPAYYALDALARYLYRRADRIIVLARGTGDYLASRGVDRKKLVYVPNGADAPAFAASPWSENAPPTLPAPFTVVYAGAHGPANGLDTVLDAAALLASDGASPPVRFLLVGDGPSKSALQASARARNLTNVEFRDPVPKRDMPALLAATNAGLMVLREAPLFAFAVSPNKLFDYLAAALPVACNVPGEVAAMLRDSGAGDQAVDSSAAALAQTIRRLARRSPEERARMGAAGRAWVAREHGRDVVAQRLHSALSELIASQR